jgi:photosystem II stability/assembly factor-like uncharacterized protein
MLKLFILSNAALSQTTPVWQTLSNAPSGTRNNDVYFVTPKMGWIVNGSGQIYKTPDGGASWQLQFQKSAAHFRSIGFTDSLRGWAGNVGVNEFGATDSSALYQTKDGGASWMPVNSFIGPAPRGLCGMNVVNDSVICAVGRVRGPSFFARTTDGGKTWTSKDMNAYAAGLIDVYFFHPDSGFAVGLTNVNHESSSGIILFTADGGATWEPRFVTTRTGEWCWKISFPSRRVAYVSLQRNTQSPIYFLKTTNGGATWQEKLFSNSQYFVQGIGFATELKGWIGGNSQFPTYETTDGGETWHPAAFGARVNRFRFLNDSTGYAAGQYVYKYSPPLPVGIAENNNEIPRSFTLKQNFPNPFNPNTVIRFTLAAKSFVRLKIYDVQGRETRQLINAEQNQGEHAVNWDGKDESGRPAGAGIYFYSIEVGKQRQTRKMALLK